MMDLPWRVEHSLIIALRSPGKYLLVVSGISSGLFTSLEISEPVKTAIDSLPYIVNSDWLSWVMFTVILGIILHIAGMVISPVFGFQPFEAITSYVDSMSATPTLTEYVAKRLERSSSSDSSNISYRVRNLERKELDEFNQLNREVFRYTAFALPLDKIRQRNEALFAANPSMFALVDADIDGDHVPVGISHVIPLSDIGKAVYVRDNGIKDSELRPEHVAKPGEWSNGIVMFSMGIARPFRHRLKDKARTLPYVFADHLTLLILGMREHNPEETSTFVYAQTEKPHGGIGRMLSAVGFEDIDIKTGDGYALWEMRIDLPLPKTQRSPETALSEVIGRSALYDKLTRRSA